MRKGGGGRTLRREFWRGIKEKLKCLWGSIWVSTGTEFAKKNTLPTGNFFSRESTPSRDSKG